MKTKETLKQQIDSFSKLKKDWDSYDGDEITPQSIETAKKVLDTLPEFLDMQTINVSPMRDGGVQIDVGESKEIEVLNNTVTEIQYDLTGEIINKYVYQYNSGLIFDKSLLEKIAIKQSEYVMGVDIGDKNTHTYCLGRKVDGVFEIILSKTTSDEKEFKQEVENLVKYFNAKQIA